MPRVHTISGSSPAYLVAWDCASGKSRIWRKTKSGAWPSNALGAMDFPHAYASTRREATRIARRKLAVCRKGK